MEKSPEEDTQKTDYELPPRPTTPRWVKITGVLGLVLVIVFVIMHLTGHSPFMHMHGMKG